MGATFPFRIDSTVVVPPRYCGDIDYYALLALYRRHRVDTSMPFNKRQKSVHRMTIADTRGRLQLTVPVRHPESSGRARWSDIRVSTHGEWWAPQLTALESAYGRTPFFEFYIDRFKPFFAPRSVETCETVTDLDMAMHRVILDILGLPCPVADAEAADGDVVDFTRRDLPVFPVLPYYQVRRDTLGFQPGLSVLDLIFNMGPESPLVLDRMISLYQK